MNNQSIIQNRYDKQNTKQVVLKLNLKTDSDILNWLETQPNKQGAIKLLIREKLNK